MTAFVLLLVILPTAQSRISLQQGATLGPADNNLNILALPVGQGDATVIQRTVQDGGKITIVDLGSTKDTGFGKPEIVHYLYGHHIEYIFLTHADKDHCSYVDGILNDRQPSQYPTIYHPCK